MKAKKMLLVAFIMAAMLVVTRYSLAQEVYYSDNDLTNDEVSSADISKESELSTGTKFSEE